MWTIKVTPEFKWIGATAGTVFHFSRSILLRVLRVYIRFLFDQKKSFPKIILILIYVYLQANFMHEMPGRDYRAVFVASIQ